MQMRGPLTALQQSQRCRCCWCGAPPAAAAAAAAAATGTCQTCAASAPAGAASRSLRWWQRRAAAQREGGMQSLVHVVNRQQQQWLLRLNAMHHACMPPPPQTPAIPHPPHLRAACQTRRRASWRAGHACNASCLGGCLPCLQQRAAGQQWVTICLQFEPLFKRDVPRNMPVRCRHP